jgi:hypothetical protein
MLGLSKAELLGRHVRDVTHRDYGQGAQYRAHVARSRGGSEAGEKRFLRRTEIRYGRRTCRPPATGERLSTSSRGRGHHGRKEAANATVPPSMPRRRHRPCVTRRSRPAGEPQGREMLGREADRLGVWLRIHLPGPRPGPRASALRWAGKLDASSRRTSAICVRTAASSGPYARVSVARDASGSRCISSAASNTLRSTALSGHAGTWSTGHRVLTTPDARRSDACLIRPSARAWDGPVAALAVGWSGASVAMRRGLACRRGRGGAIRRGQQTQCERGARLGGPSPRYGDRRPRAQRLADRCTGLVPGCDSAARFSPRRDRRQSRFALCLRVPDLERVPLG